MVWKSFVLVLWICSAVSYAQVTKVEEVSMDSDQTNDRAGSQPTILESQPYNNPNNYPMQVNPSNAQNYRSPYSNPMGSYNPYTRPMYGGWSNPGMNQQIYTPQQPQQQYNAWPVNYMWGGAPLQQQQPQSDYGSYYPAMNNNNNMEQPQQQQQQQPPTLSTYTDYNSGFYPGNPNWRKSYTPSGNGCYNRCRPTCGNSGGNYNYGCRPNCRSSCNIRPTCGSSMPSYYGNTMVCSKNRGYYQQQQPQPYGGGGYQSNIPQQMNYNNKMDGSQMNPTLATTASSG